MRPAGFRNFLLLASSLLFVGLSAVPQSFSPSLRSWSGATCRLSQAESERRCRAPGQPPGVALCHGRGQCDCGVCICHVKEPGVYFGPLCECHEWVCETYDGRTCADLDSHFCLTSEKSMSKLKKWTDEKVDLIHFDDILYHQQEFR